MKEKPKTITLRRIESVSSKLPESRHLIAAALACGFRPVEGNWYEDTVEGPETLEALKTAKREDLKREVCWTLDARSRATFTVNGRSETITFQEFVKRFEDEVWCRANADHPIAYQRETIAALKKLTADLRQPRLRLKLQRGNRVLLVPPDGKPEETAKFLNWFNHGW